MVRCLISSHVTRVRWTTLGSIWIWLARWKSHLRTERPLEPWQCVQFVLPDLTIAAALPHTLHSVASYGSQLHCSTTLFESIIWLSHLSLQPLEAERLYNEAIRLDPNHSDALNNLGTNRNAAGYQDEAIGLYNKSIKVWTISARPSNGLWKQIFLPVYTQLTHAMAGGHQCCCATLQYGYCTHKAWSTWWRNQTLPGSKHAIAWDWWRCVLVRRCL